MLQDGDTETFPVNGQGTFVYTKNVPEKFAIYVTPKKNDERKVPSKYIKLEVGLGEAKFMLNNDDGKGEIQLGSTTAEGAEPNILLSYWLSYDRDACVIKYGKGYVMVQTTLLKYDFLEGLSEQEQEERKKELADFFSPGKPQYVMVFLTPITKGKVLINVEKPFNFETNPLAGNYSPIVIDSSELTLFELDTNQFMPSASLSAACHTLYQNVKSCELEYPRISTIKLSDAIRYSLETKGKCLNTILENKKGEFGDPSMVYIRVTLGPDLKTGPGIPYVLEIWPKQCKSPIHSHGAACAVIKVLFGEIHIGVYNKASNPPKKMSTLMEFDAKHGQFTWMDHNWFQSHQLKNISDDFCATIQSYRYTDVDSIHWPGFDYISEETGEVYAQETFLPNSDITFIKMRDTVLKEYEESLKGTA